MTTRQPRKRLHSHVTRSRFLHLEDALDIGKVRLFAGEYKRGQGSNATVHHFLDLADARVLLADLSWGKKVEFTDYKGSGGDDPQSRVLKIKTNGDKVWFEIQNGPGQIIGQGAVKPAGKPDAAVSIPLTVWEARKLAHAALAYIRAWEIHHLLDAAPSGPIGGGGDAAPQARPAAPAPGKAKGTASPPPSMATETGHQVTAPAATGVAEIESTSTGFWTLYNQVAKAAGVAYPFARSIANKYGDDWSSAIARLREAMTVQTAAAQAA